MATDFKHNFLECSVSSVFKMGTEMSHIQKMVMRHLSQPEKRTFVVMRGDVMSRGEKNL